LNNPVMIASGTFGYDGYGRGITSDMDLGALGAVIPKTVTREPREGNPEPRWYPASYREAWAEGDQLFLNSIGLTNPGIEGAMRDLAPQWDQLFLNSIGLTNPGIEGAMRDLAPQWDQWDATVLLSFAADSVGQFAEMAAMTCGVRGFQAIELNLSCPNVADGALFSHSAALTHDAVAAVKANTGLPVLAKLAPNVPDITAIARSAEAGGADALTLCNTIPAMRIDAETRRPVLGNITGGLSGMGLRPVSLYLVYQTAQAVDIPIIGVGGIFEAEHALEYIMAGAAAVQIGSANLVDPATPWRVLDELKVQLARSGVSSPAELRGVAQKSPVG
jgi:dihydroorotate dehydrogenase (NAD+) catalytic subunit